MRESEGRRELTVAFLNIFKVHHDASCPTLRVVLCELEEVRLYVPTKRCAGVEYVPPRHPLHRVYSDAVLGAVYSIKRV